MSRQMVGIVIQTLLTDENVRERFAVDPFETLADLSLRGVELTKNEIDALVRVDARIWFWSPDLFGGHVH